MSFAQNILVFPVCLFGAFVLWTTGSTGTFISNLNNACFACLCNVMSECDLTLNCSDGYCGPFYIPKLQWADAGKVTLPGQDPKKNGAWENCSSSYNCSRMILSNYFEKYGRDCNSDGVTDCFDYMMIHGNGGHDCSAPLNRTDYGQEWIERYEKCRLFLE